MFNKTKKYNVCLTVINNKGLYDIECKEVIIEENPENVCNADFIYMIDSTSKTVQFTNKSTGNYNQVIWDFNDGGTSTDPNPVHSYSMPGYYLVSLKISNSETKQYDYSFKLLNIASPDSFLVKFAYLSHPYNQKAGGYPIDFIGAGLGDQAKLKWDFGDGASDSTSTTPQHIYSQPGDYQTCLTYSDPITDNSTTYCDVVTTQTICNSDLEPPVAICKELTLYLKEGQSITLTPDQIDNGSYDECGTISKKEISKTTFNAIGSYNVMLKVYDSKNNADSCSTIVNVQPDVSVNNIQNLSYLNVFPNPFGYELKINYSINKSGKIEILITDIAGKRVKNLKHGFVEKGSYSEVYSTSDIEKGVYILQVTIDGQLNGQKFVIKQ